MKKQYEPPEIKRVNIEDVPENVALAFRQLILKEKSGKKLLNLPDNLSQYLSKT